MIFWRDPGTKLVKSLARYRATRDAPGFLNWALNRYHKFELIMRRILTATHIERDAQIDASVFMPHPTGIVIHQDAVIGKNCIIMQQVTIGQTGDSGAPMLEEGVYVGAGAKILGDITIGANAKIGANAVVLKDVPANCTAVGVPACILDDKN